MNEPKQCCSTCHSHIVDNRCDCGEIWVDHAYRVRRTREGLARVFGRSPTDAEVAAALASIMAKTRARRDGSCSIPCAELAEAERGGE